MAQTLSQSHPLWNKTLLIRVITAAVLIPIVLLAVLKLSVKGFLIAWGVIILAAAWEWSALAGIRKIPGRVVFLLMVLAAQALAWYWPKLVGWLATAANMPDLLILTMVLDWLVWPTVIAWLVFGFVIRKWPDRLIKRPWPAGAKVFVAWFVLFTAWLLMSRLRANFGSAAVLYLLFLVWLADTGAYFAGKKWGKNPLIPEVSPGKTFEGVFGALLVCAIYTGTVGYFLEMKATLIMDFVMLALITVLISICGDLLISLYKRWAGVKDSGRLLPGHGGLLDRIDSLMAAAPVVYAGFLARVLFW